MGNRKKFGPYTTFPGNVGFLSSQNCSLNKTLGRKVCSASVCSWIQIEALVRTNIWAYQFMIDNLKEIHSLTNRPTYNEPHRPPYPIPCDMEYWPDMELNSTPMHTPSVYSPTSQSMQSPWPCHKSVWHIFISLIPVSLLFWSDLTHQSWFDSAFPIKFILDFLIRFYSHRMKFILVFCRIILVTSFESHNPINI